LVLSPARIGCCDPGNTELDLSSSALTALSTSHCGICPALASPTGGPTSLCDDRQLKDLGSNQKVCASRVTGVATSSAGRFVVKATQHADLKSAADAERLTDDLVVVTSAEGRANKESWRKLLDENKDVAWAQPVLVDDDGHERYPTGELTVRFDEPPTDKELEIFARSRNLRTARRNAYQPAQVVLVPAEPRAVFLPELCDELERIPGVTRAWLNSLSHYTRT
jgi:hypothetical protein